MPNPLYVPAFTPGKRQLQDTIQRDLIDQANEILARPGAKTPFGFLNPRVVSKDEGRIIAQAYPHGYEQQGRPGKPISGFGVLNRPIVTPEQVQKLPGPLQPFGSALRELTSPTQIGLMAATAGLGPTIEGVIRGGTGVVGAVRGTAANLVAPIAKGAFPTRLATEVGVQGAAQLGAAGGAKLTENAPAPVRVATSLAGGLASGVGALGVARGVGRVLPEALTNVPVRPVQEAGLRLAGGRVMAGGAENLPLSSATNNPIGLRDIAPGLTKQQEIRNVARRLVTKGSLGMITPIEDNPIATAAMVERARVKPIVSSVANALGTSAQSRIETAFVLDKNGGIPSLAGIDKTIEGAPTIADVAARLPTFQGSLSAEQMAALESVRQDIAPYRAMLESKGLDIGNRPDVVEGGFYIPRGRADMEGLDAPIKVRPSTGRAGGKRGFERSAVFNSQAEGISKGYTYSPVGESLTSYTKDAGNRATETHVANYFKGVTDTEGNVIGETLKSGEAVPRGRQMIALPGIQGWTYPDEIANAANKILNTEGPTRGALSDVVNVANAFNNLYRGLRATLDDSALGVQGLLGLAGDQKAYGRALKLNIQAWGIGGDKALGKFLVDFDQRAMQDGVLTSQQWAREGLNIGGATSEFQMGQGVGKLATFTQNLPGVRQANRAFGYFGDGLRTIWANDEIKSLLSQGHTLEEILANGDAERIATAVNNATGYARGRAFGSMGELLLFAPRFLQSRLETVVRATSGLLPGATLDQRIARTSLLKLIGGATMLTVAANYVLGRETDFRPIVDGKRNGNFMRIQYQGQNYSLLGTWDSLAGAIINTATLHPNRVLRSMASGTLSNAWDLIGGRDYNFNRTRDTPVHFAEWLLRSMLPFSASQAGQGVGQIAQGIQTSNPWEAVGGGIGAAAQVGGVKSYPVSTPKPSAPQHRVPTRIPRRVPSR